MKLSFIKVTALLCFIFLLSNCSLHKPAGEYKTPKSPEKFNTETETETKKSLSDLSSKWWLKYNDEGLSTIIEEVLKNNTDIDQAYQRFVQASAYAKGKSTDLFPQFDINGNAKSEDSEDNNSSLNTYSLSLAASYEIDLWGKISAAKKAANFSRQATVFDLKTIYISISAQAAELYFRAAEKQEDLILCREKVKLNQENLQIANLNYQEGLSDASSVYFAKQNLAAAQAEIILQKAVYEKLFHALSILQGKYPEMPENYSIPELCEFREEFPKGIPSDLLKNRPDIQKALAGLRAADYEIGIAIAKRFPSLSLGANIGYAGSDMTGSMVRGTFTSIAGNLIMPVLDWGKRKAEVKRVKSKFNESLFAFKKAVLNGFMEAEDAISDYNAAADSLEKIKMLERYSNANYKQMDNKYLYGLTKYTSVITSKTQYIDTKKRLNQAKLEIILKNISLVRAMGGSWMNEDIKRKNEQEKG